VVPGAGALSPVWSYVAIYRLKHFLWAAGQPLCSSAWPRYGPSGSSFGTGEGRLQWCHAPDVAWSLGAAITWTTLLRAAVLGALGYYLDICWPLPLVPASLLLVARRPAPRARRALRVSGDLQRAGAAGCARRPARPAAELAAVRGSALFSIEDRASAWSWCVERLTDPVWTREPGGV